MGRLRHRVLSRLLLVFFGVLLALLLLEGALRLVLPGQDYFVEPHPLFGRFIIPSKEGWSGGFTEFNNFLRFNSQGFRSDREYSYAKPGGTFRILVIGDSFIQAVQVPLQDTFYQLLEGQLNSKQTGQLVEVLPVGVGGWSTQNELLYFENEGYRFQPDLVLLFFFYGNDVTDNDPDFPGPQPRFPAYVLQGKALELRSFPLSPLPRPTTVASLRHWLGKHSRIALITFYLSHRSPPLARFFNRLGLLSANEVASIYEWLYAKQYSREEEQRWELTRGLLRRLKQNVEATGARLGVVLIADRFQLEPGLWQERLKQLPPSPQDGAWWDLDKPHRLVKQIVEAEDIPYLDMLPPFAEAQPGRGPLHFRGDGHWTPAAHRLVAETLSEWLRGKWLK